MTVETFNDLIAAVDWESAIKVRRSTRSFEMHPVEAETAAQLENFIELLQVPFEHKVTVRCFKAQPNKKLYTIFNAPPDNVAFLAETDPCSITKTGFIGELIILYATALGLATCWYGHYTLTELEKVMPHLEESALQSSPRFGYGKGKVEGKRAICISPLGYWEEKGVRFIDRMQTALFSHRRKPLAALLENSCCEQELTPDILYALDLARRAPSGANSQHWRFKPAPDFKTISLFMPEGYRHVKWEHPDVDIGICASHIWLGLRLRNINPRVAITEEKGRAVWRFELQPDPA